MRKGQKKPYHADSSSVVLKPLTITPFYGSYEVIKEKQPPPHIHKRSQIIFHLGLHHHGHFPCRGPRTVTERFFRGTVSVFSTRSTRTSCPQPSTPGGTPITQPRPTNGSVSLPFSSRPSPQLHVPREEFTVVLYHLLYVCFYSTHCR